MTLVEAGVGGLVEIFDLQRPVVLLDELLDHDETLVRYDGLCGVCKSEPFVVLVGVAGIKLDACWREQVNLQVSSWSSPVPRNQETARSLDGSTWQWRSVERPAPGERIDWMVMELG